MLSKSAAESEAKTACKAINWGTLQEIPGICINRFRSSLPFNDADNPVEWRTNRAFFLTHHDDQTVKDVLSQEFLLHLANSGNCSSRLYLHELSFTYIVRWGMSSNDATFRCGAKMLTDLKRNNKVVLISKATPLRLTFIREANGYIMASVLVHTLSAGHNPGSVMLFFETTRQRILFTGNCRVSLNDLKQCGPLHMADGSVKPLTSLYVDTIFCSENVQELPARKAITDKLFKEIKDNLPTSPDYRYEFWCSDPLPFDDNYAFVQSVYYGFRGDIQVDLAEELRVHSNESEEGGGKDYCLLRFLPGFNPSKHLESGIRDSDDSETDYRVPDPTEVRFGCDMRDGCEDDIQLNIKKRSIYRESDNRMRGIFSNHLSRYEVTRLINYLGLDLKDVQPLYLPSGLDISQLVNVLRSSCDFAFGQEPKDILDEHPSHVYDCTGSFLDRLSPEGKLTPIIWTSGKTTPPLVLSDIPEEYLHLV